MTLLGALVHGPRADNIDELACTRMVGGYGEPVPRGAKALMTLGPHQEWVVFKRRPLVIGATHRLLRQLNPRLTGFPVFAGYRFVALDVCTRVSFYARPWPVWAALRAREAAARLFWRAARMTHGRFWHLKGEEGTMFRWRDARPGGGQMRRAAVEIVAQKLGETRGEAAYWRARTARAEALWLGLTRAANLPPMPFAAFVDEHWRGPQLVHSQRGDDECPHGYFVGRGCLYGCVDDVGDKAR